MATLWGMLASWLSNVIVKGFPAGAARQFVSNAMLFATPFNVVPLGWHAAGEGAAVVAAGGGGEKAMAAPTFEGTARSMSPLGTSYQATATDLPSGEAATEGVTPPRLSGRGCIFRLPGFPVARSTSWVA